MLLMGILRLLLWLGSGQAKKIGIVTATIAGIYRAGRVKVGCVRARVQIVIVVIAGIVDEMCRSGRRGQIVIDLIVDVYRLGRFYDMLWLRLLLILVHICG